MEEFSINGTSLKYCTSKDSECIIPDGIKTIESRAFVYNTFIKSVKMPDTVEEVYSSAFSFCGSLEKIEI